MSEELDLTKFIQKQLSEFHLWGNYRVDVGPGYPEYLTPEQRSQWEKFDSEPKGKNFWAEEPKIGLPELKKLILENYELLDGLKENQRASGGDTVFNPSIAFALGKLSAYNAIHVLLTGIELTDEDVRGWTK